MARVHNIFTTNHKWLVIIGLNLNLPLKLFFYPISNNLIIRFCYENVVYIIFFFRKTINFSLYLKLLFIFFLLIFLFIVKVKKEKEEIEISAVTLLGTIGVLISGE